MTPDDLAIVSNLGIASKRSWGYDADRMSVFAPELTISRDAFASLLDAEVACVEGEVVGFYTLRRHSDGSTELEHLFVAPDWSHRGVGSLLLGRALERAALRGAAKLLITADPNSAGFYERFGAWKIGDRASSIPNRTIPMYEISTDARGAR